MAFLRLREQLQELSGAKSSPELDSEEPIKLQKLTFKFTTFQIQEIIIDILIKSIKTSETKDLSLLLRPYIFIVRKDH